QGSSIFCAGDRQVKVAMQDVSSFISKEGITKIDLIKINIEGGEYALLPRMIETGAMKICEHLQIQFHKWHGSPRARHAIQKALRSSHELSYDYPFVWEGWKKKRGLQS